MANAAAAKKEETTIETTGSALSLIPEKLDAVQLYSETGINEMIAAVRKTALAEVRDVATPSGRKAIASLAHKVARSKTLLDDAGESLIEEARKKVTSINGLRKKVRDELDALKDEVRRPLTEWENADKERMAAHEAALAEIEQTGRNAIDMWMSMEIPAMEASLNKIRGDNRDYQELTARHEIVKKQAIANLEGGIAKKKKHEAEQAELKRLRESEEKRQREEREAKIASEAAEKARKEAEEKAAAERKAGEERERKAIEEKEAAEKREREAEERRVREAQEAKDREARIAKENEERAERDRKANDERVERERKEAVEAEQRREAQRKRDEEEAAAKREADKKHQAKINGEALKVLSDIIGADGNPDNHDETAKAIVTAIAKGEVPHIKIFY